MLFSLNNESLQNLKISQNRVAIELMGMNRNGNHSKHWRYSTLADVCELIRDGTHLPPKRTEEGPLLLGVANLIDGRLHLTDSYTRVPYSFYNKMHSNWELKSGDVLLAIVGATIGKTASVPEEFPVFTLQRSVAVLRGNPKYVSNDFLRRYLNTPIGQREIWKRVNQTAQPGIYLGEIEKIPLPVPPLEEQDHICATLHQFACQQLELERNIKNLKQLRIALCNRLILGIK